MKKFNVDIDFPLGHPKMNKFIYIKMPVSNLESSKILIKNLSLFQKPRKPSGLGKQLKKSKKQKTTITIDAASLSA